MAGKQANTAPVDGILLLNKPAGMTSNRALQRVKRKLRAKKAGHAGSLDPAATGMLPLCFGEATKVCAFLLDADKTYRVTARLGVATDTGDAEGTETESAAVPDLDVSAWTAILDGFLGESMQVPPMYSALKQGGRRLYELARQGEVVDRPPRPIRVLEISLLELAGTRLVFRVRCSKGTYVRTLVEDIARQAGTVAHTAHLHRETVRGFEAARMVDLDAVETLAEADAGSVAGWLLPPDAALQELPAVTLTSGAVERFRQGQAVSAGEAGLSGLVRVYGPGEARDFIGVGEIAGPAVVAPKRIFGSA